MTIKVRQFSVNNTHLTKGKIYETKPYKDCAGLAWIVDDEGYEQVVVVDGDECAHLGQGGTWEIVEDGNPLKYGIEALKAELLAKKIELEAMLAENQYHLSKDTSSPYYGEDAFLSLAKEVEEIAEKMRSL